MFALFPGHEVGSMIITACACSTIARNYLLYTDCVNFTILWNGLEAVAHAQAVDIGPLFFSFMSWQQCCSYTTTSVIFLFSGRCCCGFFWLWWCCSFVLLLSSVLDVQYSSSTTVSHLTSWELSMAFLCPSQQCSGESGVRWYSWWPLIEQCTCT